jgi:signal transduction histidine kinase
MADAHARDQRLRRTMMADIAHELRTPLSIIQANLEAMQDGVLAADPQEIAHLQARPRSWLAWLPTCACFLWPRPASSSSNSRLRT